MSENSVQPPQKITRTPLKITIGITTLLATLALIVASIFFPGDEILLGIAFGAVIGMLNYVFLVKIIEKLVVPDGSGKVKMTLLLVFKMLALVGLVALAVFVVRVDIFAFLVGYLCLIAVILLQGLLGKI